MRRMRVVALAVVAVVAVFGAGSGRADDPAAGTIETVAGGGVGEGRFATEASLDQPTGVAVGDSGIVYIADQARNRVLKVDTNGILTTLAGNGTSGYSGDGGPAMAAQLDGPSGVAVDSSGNVYIADTMNHCVRRVNADGNISTVVGMGLSGNGNAGDGSYATSAWLDTPRGVAVDGNGVLYIADSGNNRVRKVENGIVTAFAGTGIPGYAGDGDAATRAKLSYPSSIAVRVTVDGVKSVYIADTGNLRIRKVEGGTIHTIAGSGQIGYAGDGGAATAAKLRFPTGVVVDEEGVVYIADNGNQRIRRVAGGIITTIAGSGTRGFSGDGDAATAARLSDPQGVAVDGAGRVLVADTWNRRIRAVEGGDISTLAGNGTLCSVVEGGPATASALPSPLDGLAVDGSGRVYISAPEWHRVLMVDTNGILTTFAGTGTSGHSGDNGPAAEAQLSSPSGLAADGGGNLYIADSDNHRVRRVDADGTISTVAGTGTAGFSGDGGAATGARLYHPSGLAVNASGDLYVADRWNYRVRKVASGIISTVAGSGGNYYPSYSGDGGRAIEAGIGPVRNVAVDGDGNLYFGTGNDIRRVSEGVITTVATTGDSGGVAVDGAGSLFISSYLTARVLKWDGGNPSYVAGIGFAGFAGEGGPADEAILDTPLGVAVDASGNLYIADSGNRRIRRIWGIAATSTVSLTGPAAIAREADVADGATTPVLLQVAGTVPSGAALVVRDVTGNRTVYGPTAAAVGTVGFSETFPIGTSTVVAEVVQGATVLATFTFTVQVNDTVAPVLSGVADATVELAGAITPIHPWMFGIVASDVGDPHPAVELSPSALPLGTTTVTVTAADATGNTTTATLAVTVRDTLRPEFTVAPDPVTRDCTDGTGAVNVVFDVQAMDLAGPVTIVCTDERGNAVDPAGTSFAVGEHVVTCVATDSSGNSRSYAFTVSVADRTAPVMVLPPDVSVTTDPGAATAAVAFAVAASDDVSDVTITTTVGDVPVVSGHPFPVGTTTVTCTATDAAGNVSTDTFSVLVRDLEPPVITAPASVTLVTDVAGNPMAFSPAMLGATATDNCDPHPTLSCSPSIVSPGAASVTLTAADADGNTSTKEVAVTVLKGPFTVTFVKPLEGGIDNSVNIPQTIPLHIKVSANGTNVPGATARIDEIVRIDGTGTPIAQPIDDAGQSADNGVAMTYLNGSYKYNLSTKDWDDVSGARYRLTIRVTMAGHADTLTSIVFVNR